MEAIIHGKDIWFDRVVCGASLVSSGASCGPEGPPDILPQVPVFISRCWGRRVHLSTIPDQAWVSKMLMLVQEYSGLSPSQWRSAAKRFLLMKLQFATTPLTKRGKSKPISNLWLLLLSWMHHHPDSWWIIPHPEVVNPRFISPFRRLIFTMWSAQVALRISVAMLNMAKKLNRSLNKILASIMKQHFALNSGLIFTEGDAR